MSALLAMAQWATALRMEHVPDGVRERLRMQAASVFAAAATGLGSDAVQPALVAARAMGPGGLRVAPGVDGLTLEGALLAGSALSVVDEYDDWMLCGHTGHSAVWAAWLGAAHRGLGWDDALRAQLAANEILARIGGLCIAGRQDGQRLTFLHAVGGALVSGLLRGSTPEQLASGMALALAQASRVDSALLATPGRVLCAAQPLLDGWRLADLAAAGLHGPTDLLDGESEFLQHFAGGKPAHGWLSGLPTEDPARSGWLTWSLAIKCVPGAPSLGPTVEALQIALGEAKEARGTIGPDDIQRIDVDGGALTTAVDRLLGAMGDGRPGSVRASVRTALATVVLTGTWSPAASRGVDPKAIAALAERIRLHHDWRLTRSTWNGLRAIGLDDLLGELGPGQLLTAGRAGGLEAGLSLTELPLALASERLQGVQPDQLPALFGRSLTRLTELAARGVERFLPAAERPATFDLAAQPLEQTCIPLPSRVLVLLHGGHVHEGSVETPLGAPGRDAAEMRRAVRDKLLTSLQTAAPQGSHVAFVDGMLGAGNAPHGAMGALPGPGPASMLGS